MLTKSKLPSPEELLGDYTRRLDRHREGRQAYWIHLSRLARANRHEFDIRLAANLLRPLARRFQGEVFALASGDIIMCLKQPDAHMVESVLFDVRFSFAHDPLMQKVDAGGPGIYLTVYDVGHGYEAFAAAVSQAGAGAPSVPEPEPVPELGTAHLIMSRAELRARPTAASLAGHVDTSQGRIAVERLLERRTIARLEEPRIAKPWGVREHVRDQALDAFDALSTAVARHQMSQASALAEIERLLLPGWTDLLAREGTSRHLLLFRTETLISPEFLVLHRWIEEKRLEKPAIGFLLEDVLSDKETADYLRGFLRENGYRFGLAAVPLSELGTASAALSGVKFIEIDAAGDISTETAARLRQAVAEHGEEAVLATNLLTPAAIEAAFKAGIRLVSGPAVRT